jgi:hypothetical protein
MSTGSYAAWIASIAIIVITRKANPNLIAFFITILLLSSYGLLRLGESLGNLRNHCIVKRSSPGFLNNAVSLTKKLFGGEMEAILK